ncbi:MAG: hypothetical protein JJ920_20595 [Roseitalea sp.]|nr:hypothetical protein [Roseitalea sp.]MBO6723517.1 hypothetical protein [Roseitalea sp.]MBO6745313.1 hypothetical protein [Roseitalea sp.]
MAKRDVLAFARDNWRLVGIFVAAMAVALFLVLTVFLDFVYFNDPRNVDVDLKPWMTPRVVVMTCDLPRLVVFKILALDRSTDAGIRLRHVAERQGISMEELTVRVREVAGAYREAQP